MNQIKCQTVKRYTNSKPEAEHTMIKRNIILLTMCLAIVGCGTKKENKESVMDKEIAVISTKFGDIKLEFFDEIAQTC